MFTLKSNLCSDWFCRFSSNAFRATLAILLTFFLVFIAAFGFQFVFFLAGTRTRAVPARSTRRISFDQFNNTQI